MQSAGGWYKPDGNTRRPLTGAGFQPSRRTLEFLRSGIGGCYRQALLPSFRSCSVASLLPFLDAARSRTRACSQFLGTPSPVKYSCASRTSAELSPAPNRDQSCRANALRSLVEFASAINCREVWRSPGRESVEFTGPPVVSVDAPGRDGSRVSFRGVSGPGLEPGGALPKPGSGISTGVAGEGGVGD